MLVVMPMPDAQPLSGVGANLMSIHGKGACATVRWSKSCRAHLMPWMAQRTEAKDSLDDFPTPRRATRVLIEQEPPFGRAHMAQAPTEYFGEVNAMRVHPSSCRTVVTKHEPSTTDWCTLISAQSGCNMKQLAFYLGNVGCTGVGHACWVHAAGTGIPSQHLYGDYPTRASVTKRPKPSEKL